MKDFKKSLDLIVNDLNEELKGIRVGRANAGLVENVEVEYYGAKSPLKQVAQISVPDAKTIMISPWNKDDLVTVEKAINESDLNLTPNNNGESIILNLPAMTEERRQELIKISGKNIEESRVKIRKEREYKIDEFVKQEKEGEISENELFNKKQEIQEIVDEYMQKIEDIKEKKEKDIMTI